MTKITTQNYFTTTLSASVDASIVGEIEFQLAVVPNSDIGYLILDYVDPILREEIFYHRKAGNSVFTYGINRTNPQAHDFEASVQMNDSSSIFNYITNLLPDHFFMYKTDTNSMYIRGGTIYDNGSYETIDDVTDLVFDVGTNYLYIDEGEILTTTDSLTDKLIFGDVILNGGGVITAFNNYNTISIQTGRPNIIIRGAGAPASGTGIDGDYYIDDTRSRMYGPKTSGSWGTYFSFEGQEGDPGDAGTITVGTVNTGVAGSEVDIENVGTAEDAILNFTIPKGDAGDIAEAPAGEEQTILDNGVPAAGTVVTTDDSTYIKLTYSNGVYTQYNLGSIVTGDATNIYTTTTKSPVGVFGATSITYDDGLVVNKTTGVTSFTGAVMYKDQNNVVGGDNTFNGDSIFAGQTSFKYNVNATGITEFDANDGTKQGFNFNSGAVAMTFVNLLDGGTLTFSVTVNTSDVTLSIGTATRKGDDNAYSKFNLSNETYPFVLATGTHMFIAEVFSAGIHIAYAGTSVSI